MVFFKSSFARRFVLASSACFSMALQAQGLSEDDRVMLRNIESDSNISAIIDEMELEVLRLDSSNNLSRNAPNAEHFLPSPTSWDAESLGSQRQQAKEASAKFYHDHEIIIFASSSLEKEGLEDILEAAAANPRVVVVFRGVPEGMRIDEGVREIQRLAYSFDPMPSIAIDPTMFDEHGIDMVPAIVVMEPSPPKSKIRLPELSELLDENYDASSLLDDINTLASGALEERRILAKVQGLSDPAWLVRQLQDGQRGDLGIQGPLSEIAEPHLIELMKNRALEIDWEQQKKAALDRFWANQASNMRWKPAATQHQLRRIDPIVKVTQDIRDAHGNLLVPAGQEYNQLERTPFNTALVIFDGSDPGQVQVAFERGRELEKNHSVMYLMTRFDTLEGWDGYTSVTDILGRHTYLLTSDVEERFSIERVPSIVTADSDSFIVEEVVAPRLASQIPATQE